MSVSGLIDAIRPRTRATEVFGDLIPSPPHAESACRGNHLFLNFRYPMSVVEDCGEDQIISLIRSEVPGILQAIVSHLSKTLFKSVCLSAFLPHAGDFVRIYRYNILASELPDDVEGIDVQFVKTHCFSEITDDKLMKQVSALRG